MLYIDFSSYNLTLIKLSYDILQKLESFLFFTSQIKGISGSYQCFKSANYSTNVNVKLLYKDYERKKTVCFWVSCSKLRKQNQDKNLLYNYQMFGSFLMKS